MAVVLLNIKKLKEYIMKKIMAIILFFASTTAFAQNFEFGVKGGVNVSNFTGTNWGDVKEKSLIGFHAGAFVSFFLGNNFAIQPEVLFSSQGAKYESATSKGNLKINYINVPILAKYRFANGFYLEAGPQIGFRESDLKNEGTVENHIKNTDLSLAGGLGFHSKMGLGIGARYTAGLSKVGDYDASNPLNPDYKNGVFQLSLFYTLFNGHRK